VCAIKRDFSEAEMHAAITRNGREVVHLDDLLQPQVNAFSGPKRADVRKANQTLKDAVRNATREVAKLEMEVAAAKERDTASEETAKLLAENKQLEELLEQTTERINALKAMLEQLEKPRDKRHGADK
jgi:predicted RNase H-like nuclease (RuvC/YqgF family)